VDISTLSYDKSDADRRKRVSVRVLIVEDDALIAMELAAIVEEMGCTVVGPAGQLARALGLADASAFDAALLDLNLGGQSGEQVAAVVAGRGIPFAFVTAYWPALQEGPFAGRPVVRKPFQPADIQTCLRALVPEKESPAWVSEGRD